MRQQRDGMTARAVGIFDTVSQAGRLDLQIQIVRCLHYHLSRRKRPAASKDTRIEKMFWKQTLLDFLSMCHHERIAHLNVLEDDGPLLLIAHIGGLQSLRGVPRNDIGRADRHLCSIAFFGEGLQRLEGFHSLNERKLLLTDSSN